MATEAQACFRSKMLEGQEALHRDLRGTAPLGGVPD